MNIIEKSINHLNIFDFLTTHFFLSCNTYNLKLINNKKKIGVPPAVDGAQSDGETIDTKTKTTEIDTSTTGAGADEVDNDEIIGKR